MELVDVVADGPDGLALGGGEGYDAVFDQSGVGDLFERGLETGLVGVLVGAECVDDGVVGISLGQGRGLAGGRGGDEAVELVPHHFERGERAPERATEFPENFRQG